MVVERAGSEMGGAELAESIAGELSAGEAGADRSGFGGEVFAGRGTAGCVAVVDISNSLMTDVGSTSGDIALESTATRNKADERSVFFAAR